MVCFIPSVVWDFGLGGVLLELIESTGTEGIGTDQASLPALALVERGQLWIYLPETNEVMLMKSASLGRWRECEMGRIRSCKRSLGVYLCTGGGFTRTLKTDKHNNVGLSFLGLPCLHSWIDETCKLIHDSLNNVGVE
jgi:hypothetical protein